MGDTESELSRSDAPNAAGPVSSQHADAVVSKALTLSKTVAASRGSVISQVIARSSDLGSGSILAHVKSLADLQTNLGAELTRSITPMMAGIAESTRMSTSASLLAAINAQNMQISGMVKTLRLIESYDRIVKVRVPPSTIATVASLSKSLDVNADARRILAKNVSLLQPAVRFDIFDEVARERPNVCSLSGSSVMMAAKVAAQMNTLTLRHVLDQVRTQGAYSGLLNAVRRDVREAILTEMSSGVPAVGGPTPDTDRSGWRRAYTERVAYALDLTGRDLVDDAMTVVAFVATLVVLLLVLERWQALDRDLAQDVGKASAVAAATCVAKKSRSALVRWRDHEGS